MEWPDVSSSLLYLSLWLPQTSYFPAPKALWTVPREDSGQCLIQGTKETKIFIPPFLKHQLKQPHYSNNIKACQSPWALLSNHCKPICQSSNEEGHLYECESQLLRGEPSGRPNQAASYEESHWGLQRVSPSPPKKSRWLANHQKSNCKNTLPDEKHRECEESFSHKDDLKRPTDYLSTYHKLEWLLTEAKIR